MAWEPRKKKWPLSKYLTVEEAAELAEYEAARAALAAKTPHINLIRNRAIQRARYAARSTP